MSRMSGREAMGRAATAVRNAATSPPVKVCEVFWQPETRTWAVSARGCSDDGSQTGAWGGPDLVPEGELAEALDIAHDIITGGG